MRSGKHFSPVTVAILLTLRGGWPAHGDPVDFAYEATDSYPWQSGFQAFAACSFSCVESVENGRYTANVDPGLGGGVYNYSRLITPGGSIPPPSLWVEWRFRSNYSYLQSGGFVLDDARVRTQYNQTVVSVSTWMWGDSAFDASECCSVVGLVMGELHTYRFEIADGVHSYRWGDGRLLMTNSACCPGCCSQDGTTYIQFGGSGGSNLGGPNQHGYPGLTDEWDYIRYGTLSYGEVVVAADPPVGFIDPRQDVTGGTPSTQQGITRFTVTFSQPNGLNISNITVQSTAPAALRPSVQWVTRPEGDLGATWEIRLDKRLPPGHRTRFVISDVADAAAVGQTGATSTVEYAFLPGDVNANGTATGQDVLALVQAILSNVTNPLRHDINRNGSITGQDVLRLVQLLNGQDTSQPWNGATLPPWP